MSQEKLCKSLIAKGFNAKSAIKISKKKYALEPKKDESIHDEVKPVHDGDTNLDFENKAQPIGEKTISNQPDVPTKMEAGLSPAEAPAQPNYDIHTSAAVRDDQGHRIKRKTVTEYDMGPEALDKEPKELKISELQPELKDDGTYSASKPKKYMKDANEREHVDSGEKGGQFTSQGGGGDTDKTDKKKVESSHKIVANETIKRFVIENQPKWIEKTKHLNEKSTNPIISFYDTEEFKKQYKEDSGKIISMVNNVGGYFKYNDNPNDERGLHNNLHIDCGDLEKAEGRFYHEYMHSVDKGYKGIYSSTNEWKKIWKKEIAVAVMDRDAEYQKFYKKSTGKKYPGKCKAGVYALVNEAEGFSEFGRILFTEGEEETKKNYPLAYAYFKKEGLI